MLRLLLSIALVTALMPARALAAVPAQSTSVTRGAVIKLKGTPHLWVADEYGVLHWAGDTRALNGKMVDWSAQYEVTLDQLKALTRGDPWISAGLVKIGEPIYFVKWETEWPAPQLLHIQSIQDVELFGINSDNYGAMVLDQAEWERRFGFSAGTLTKGELAAASTPGSSRENPVPRGTSAESSDGWRITVLSVTPNATSAILAANTYNKPPAPGNQFYIARVQITRIAASPSSFSGPLRLVGASNVAYSTYDNSCGAVPDPLRGAEVFPGGSIIGNVCWQVKSGDVASPVMYYSWYTTGGQQRLYFSLGA